MELDEERCYRAVTSRDERFDGWFVVGVTSTGIYCRPSCPALTPRRENVRFLRTAAAAQRAGFRACKRCAPDATPGSPEWNRRADVVGRAMRLLGDGLVDREGVEGLAGHLGYTPRHLRRLLVAEVGAGPLSLARANRAQTARILIETTELPFARVAFAAGFSSVRQFNDTVREVFAVTPGELREGARRRGRGTAGERPGDDRGGGTLALRLAHRRPADLAHSIRFLADRAVPGLEAVEDGAFRRSLHLSHGSAVATLRPGGPGHVNCTLVLEDLRDLQTAVARCRALLDLDADPTAVAAHLGDDPDLGPLVRANPGRRLVGAVDGHEAAVRVLIGQQVSVAAARGTTARLVRSFGRRLELPDGSVTHTFPDPPTLAEADPATLPMPRIRATAVVRLAAMVAGGEVRLDPGADRDEVSARLLGVPGIGPWTVQLVRLRALRDPDAFVPTDLGVRRAFARVARGEVAVAAARWRPWRSYALHHLWAVDAPTGPRPADRTPPTDPADRPSRLVPGAIT